ncbi:hypothetical protein GW17_00038080 [Ensete ventricosum]|nr:hypothetical protein GW17_00038080 [Ensete ventricosum]
MLPLRFPNSDIRAKRPACSQAVASLRQRLPTSGSRPRLACDRACRRWAVAHGQAVEAAAHRGDACGHGDRRQATCGQKLPPARVAARRNARRNARRGSAHRGVAHGRGTSCKGNSTRPLAKRLPTSKGSGGSVEGAR